MILTIMSQVTKMDSMCTYCHPIGCILCVQTLRRSFSTVFYHRKSRLYMYVYGRMMIINFKRVMSDFALNICWLISFASEMEESLKLFNTWMCDKLQPMVSCFICHLNKNQSFGVLVHRLHVKDILRGENLQLVAFSRNNL